MIATLARESRAVVVVAVASACGILAIPLSGASLAVPLLPRGMPTGWIAAITSAVILVVTVRPQWDASVLALVRTPYANAARVGLGLACAALAYAPWMVTAETAENIGWTALLAIGVAASAVAGPHGWIAVVILGIGLEVANNAGHRELAHATIAHAPAVLAVTIAVLGISLVALLRRMATPSWYRETD